MTELWDAYYEDETLAGIDLVRGEQIPQGLKHAVAEVFVMHQDGEVLLMQRDWKKPNYPGCFESGASGSVVKGESFIDGAKRELREETGIISDNLMEIYKIQNDTTIYIGYLCITDIDKTAIQLQEGETISYQWMARNEFKEYVKTDAFVKTLSKRLETFIENEL